jgi:hypothetical protein
MRSIDVAKVGPEGTVLKTVKLWSLALLVAAAAAIAMSERAEASYVNWWVDSDGHVPVYSACYPGVQLGYYSAVRKGNIVYGTIYINDCALQRLGAGPYDRQQIVAHEMGHARGLAHSPDPNSYMYWRYDITGT